MVRILPIKEFEGRKKILLVQSNIQRHTLRLQVATARQSVAHYAKKFAVVGLSSLALSTALSISGFIFARKKSGDKKTGFMSKIFSGISVFNQIKGIFSRVKSASNQV